jgi:hypothetical protein
VNRLNVLSPLEAIAYRLAWEAAFKDLLVVMKSQRRLMRAGAYHHEHTDDFPTALGSFGAVEEALHEAGWKRDWRLAPEQEEFYEATVEVFNFMRHDDWDDPARVNDKEDVVTRFLAAAARLP